MGMCVAKGTNTQIHSTTTKTASAPINQHTNSFTQHSSLNNNGDGHSTSVIDEENQPLDQTPLAVPINVTRPRRASIQPRTPTIIEEQ